MGNFKELLPKINTFVFDIDGVLSDGSILVTENGGQLRTMSTRDGVAITMALKKGYNMAIISGGNDQSVIHRLKYLGIQDIFIGVKDKIAVLNAYFADKGVAAENVLYMGDDIPDYHAMLACGVKTCPKNAVIEIKNIADYISDKDGGQGCVRDIIEQVMRCNGDWFKP
ncbi:MAG: HAD hydrolase-like protein [Flavobacteriales bacterium]|nr:HAD hydrolase-like protein [Flavobacteriales bacterium]